MDKMKNVILIVLLASSLSFAQFKEELNKPVDIKGKIITGQPSSFFTSFINPENFSMSHSVSMSYSTMGGNGMALGIYTNSMRYEFNENLDIEVDASLVNTPYNSYGDNFSNQINGIYLSRAQINYSPSDDFHMVVQYRSAPAGYYYNRPFGYRGYNNGWLFP